ncbi:MAG: hypothetical protein B6D59_02630 [Campylobacteraceae bacterium 4484_4]|nr:MAG: hypothetical protein B6D59_02630 [Campylobacteraceae bacterium 4484_4]
MQKREWNKGRNLLLVLLLATGLTVMQGCSQKSKETTTSVNESGLGVGKCGTGMQGKCKTGKCGSAIKAGGMKCGTGKCGSAEKAREH